MEREREKDEEGKEGKKKGSGEERNGKKQAGEGTGQNYFSGK